MPWSRIRCDVEEPTFGEKAEPVEGERVLTYAEATREALQIALRLDPSVFVMGQGVDDPAGLFGCTKDLHREFGARVFDTPLAESALTGMAVGAAQVGMRPVYFHNRPDFLYLALDQLANHAGKWAYMFHGKVPVPLVIWACIGRGWGSGAQHSQAPQAIFAHVPGLKVIMPSTCRDARGLMLAAIRDNNPVVIIDHRLNFRLRGHVPGEASLTPIGRGVVRRHGGDVTVVAFSHLVHEAWLAAEELAKEGIDVEVVEPRTLKPLDRECILASLEKTGRLVVADTGWLSGGITAEVAALAAGPGFASLRAPVQRVACPDTPTPSGHTLEEGFYVGRKEIRQAILRCLESRDRR